MMIVQTITSMGNVFGLRRKRHGLTGRTLRSFGGGFFHFALVGSGQQFLCLEPVIQIVTVHTTALQVKMIGRMSNLLVIGLLPGICRCVGIFGG